MSDDSDLFDDDGDLPMPTLRGNANLDPQDYARAPFEDGSSILDDEIQEDTPSRPGEGAGPATDVEGTSRFDLEPEESSSTPGIQQTDYGAYPWGPGSSEGYRPQSMMRSDMDLSGEDNQPITAPSSGGGGRDSMLDEPEVINTEVGVPVPRQRWSGNRNQMPSNRHADPDTLYDRSSYEHSDSSQDTIGSGIFDMEEGVTWRARDGIFADQYALPAYIADEDEVGVQQSEMWDTVANNWRVTQVSGGGVSFAKNVPKLKRAYSPFVSDNVPEMRAESTGPRSHIEAFGRKAARLLIAEAKRKHPQQRSEFLAHAVESFGAGMPQRVHKVAQKLIEHGHAPEGALEDTVAHAVMAATVSDLKSPGSFLPMLDKLASRISVARPAMQQAAAEHIAPLAQDKGKFKQDMASLKASSAVNGIGALYDDAPPATSSSKLLSGRNLLIAGGVGVAGYIAWRVWGKKITKNVKRLMRRNRRAA